jgi:hypothetical protein
MMALKYRGLKTVRFGKIIEDIKRQRAQKYFLVAPSIDIE